jgi:hypothetical protein
MGDLGVKNLAVWLVFIHVWSQLGAQFLNLLWVTDKLVEDRRQCPGCGVTKKLSTLALGSLYTG